MTVPSYRDIFNLHIKYVEYLLAKSLFSHQYIRNITLSGAAVEQETRAIFRAVVPKRYRVTTGYIAAARDRATEPVVTPQADLIIVDTLVPHALFPVEKETGVEIVPMEAVVGVFEIKRTLNAQSLLDHGNHKGAIHHLGAIAETAGFTKTISTHVLPGGLELEPPLTGGGYPNPILGIIGLDFDENVLDRLDAALKGTLIDMVFSFSGFLAGIRNDSGNYWIANPRTPSVEYSHKYQLSRSPEEQPRVVAKAIGYLLGYLSTCNARKMAFDCYFFNTSI